MKLFNYAYDDLHKEYRPGAEPREKKIDWQLPDEIKNDFSKLNTIIETKYTREFLKICAFYNKMFPSLRNSNWTRSFYNVPPFTSLEQERSDTGTGISQNYLKQIIDQIVSRLGTITYDVALLADEPTLEYIIYKEEVERMLRKYVRDENLTQMSLEVFHDAAILGYSHVFIDPYTHKDVKADDYSIGLFESQFNHGTIRQMLYRDYAFPTTELVDYLEGTAPDVRKKVEVECGNRATVDFKMYFDCPARKVHVILNGFALPPIDYPFDEVQIVTFKWDTGFAKVMSSSLFDLLYPCQRELNKIMAKLQQMIRIYKGPVPVFSTNADLAMKAITNGTGEALYVDSPRNATDIMTVINPTPLDPALGSEITARKTEMQELAGLQQVSFDMENMRSAAAIIAVDQTRDIVFQAQMMGRASFVQDMFKMRIKYNATLELDADVVDWEDIQRLLDSALVELKPLHLNDPMGNKGNIPQAPLPDFTQIHTARTVIAIYRDQMDYEHMSFTTNVEAVKALMAALCYKMEALGYEIPPHVLRFLVTAFVTDIQKGKVQMGTPTKSPIISTIESEPPEAEALPQEQGAVA